MSDDADDYDVFLCYAWEDKWRADALREALVADRLTVFQDDNAIDEFAFIDDRIDNALRRSRVLVVVYSQALLASPYCMQELHFALLRSERLGVGLARVLTVVPDGRYDRVRPNRLKDVRLPPSDQSMEETAMAVTRHVRRLASKDGRRLGDTPEPTPPAAFPDRWRRQIDMHGRELDLWAIHDRLFRRDDAKSSDRTAVAVVGMSGIGKSTLVESYAQQFAEHFPGGVYMSVVDGACTARQQVADVEAPYLWVVEDVPDDLTNSEVDALIASTDNGLTLFTASKAIGRLSADQHVHLMPLPRTASLAVLIDKLSGSGGSEQRISDLRANPGEWAAAGGVADELGHHPLALTLAGALVAGNDDVRNFQALQEKLRREDRSILALASELQISLPTEHGSSIATALWFSIQSLSLQGGAVHLASRLSTEPIPQVLLDRAIAATDELAIEEAHRAVTEELNGAQRASIARNQVVNGVDCWSVHPLISLAVRSMIPNQVRHYELWQNAVSVLADLFGREWTKSTPATLATYLPHVQAAAAAAEDVDRWYLLNEAARVHSELGDSSKALSLYRRLYDNCLEHLGPADPTTLAMLVGLGIAYGLAGDHGSAEQFKQQAVEQLADTVGPDHHDTLVARNNLAVTYSDMGDHERAKEIFHEVYEARLTAGGPTDTATIEAQMNYSIAVGRSGDRELAAVVKRDVYEQAEKLWGKSHPRTLDALNNVAASLIDYDPEYARIKFKELVDRRRSTNAETVDTASALENLAITTEERLERADLLAESYRIRLSVQGASHPHTRRALRRVLGTLQQDGRPEDAGSMYFEAAEILPAESNLGTVRLDADDMDEKLETHQLAMAWQQHCVDVYSPDAPVTLIAVCYLAHAHALLDQFDAQIQGAWILIDDAREGLELSLGLEHPASQAADHLAVWLAQIHTERFDS